jgi:RND family efflux transporter MFP subunit
MLALMKFTKIKLIFLLFSLGVVLIYGGTQLLKKNQDEPPVPKASAALRVTLVHPQPGSMAELISTTGVIVPREEIQVATELSGVRIKDLLVDVGDRVTKGQLLAVLDGESLVNQLGQIKSDYERVQDAYKRAEAIKNSLSHQLVLEKRTDMQAAKAKLADAQLNLKRTDILAPEAGVVYERNAVIGGLISADTPLFRLARHNEIEMEAQVPEAELSSLRVGMLAFVTLTGDSTPLEGSIRLISPKIDAVTRMAAVRIHLPNIQSMPVGLFAQVRIERIKREGLLLPRSALQQDSSGDFVWVLNAENNAERLAIQVILANDQQILLAALDANARVVARAGALVKQGDLLNVMEAK